MVLRTASLPTLAAALMASAIGAQTLQDRLDDPYEKILAKHGVDVSGRVDAQYFHSALDGSAKVDTNYSFETTQYTAFDLNMQYRAFDWIWAKADLRFYQDWQTFFATRSRVLAARWISADGNIANTLAFSAGDFREKWSQLTLWTPELEFAYEPLIFSRMRKDLMDEQYLGDNDRLLQGLDLNFAKRFDGPLSEARLDGLASRVRRGEYLDKNGYQGFNFSKSDMDRFLLGANGEAFLMQNVYLGGTYLALLDDRSSYRQTVHSAEYLQGLVDAGFPPPAGWSLNDQDSVVARDLRIVSGRAGADVAGFLGNENLVLEFTGEYALSSEANRYAWHFKQDTTGGAHFVSVGAPAPGKDGKALLVQFEAGWRRPDSAFEVGLSAAYIKNDAAYLNPLAQSPSFMGTRIMNTENDFGTDKLYSTFDALYNGVYKFSPSSRVVGSQTSYQQAPISKTSYNNGVLSPEDLARFRPDVVTQLVLPFGYATPNRVGPELRLNGQWRNLIHASVDAALLKESEAVGSLPIASLTQMGGGLMFEAGRAFGLTLPLDVEASYTRSEYKRDRAAGDLAEPGINSDLIMAGGRWRFLRKWSLLAGYQQAKIGQSVNVAEKGTGTDAKTHVYQYREDGTQRHARVGLEYSLAKNAYVLVSGGLIGEDVDASNMGTTENAEGPVAARNGHKDFTQTLSQAVIRVGF